MILRRMIEHVKAQNWFAVALDFLIVVAGVFVGMQVTNWNTAQADARLGKDYVRRLVGDLETDLATIKSEVAYYSAVLESVEQTDMLLQADNPDPRALVVNAYRATELSYSAPVRSTWDEIVSSGHLDLLPGKAAESGLSQYYSFDNAQDTYRIGLESGYRAAVRKIIPISMQIAIRESCSDVRDEWGVIVGFVERCDLDVDPAALEDVAAALRSDPAVAAELRYQYTFAVSAVLNIGGLRITLERALDALGAAPTPKADS